ncbi:hypothetical protein A4D02_22840 [Niastella koreensis]|uniref:Uncharacterized protein n=1 Tax=Niastella koreensis TaxID=354356 RepID=A0ABX3P1Y1_9BACT|nr:hypothetical protein A4D02_22840 [Niastella koreensis]
MKLVVAPRRLGIFYKTTFTSIYTNPIPYLFLCTPIGLTLNWHQYKNEPTCVTFLATFIT